MAARMTVASLIVSAIMASPAFASSEQLISTAMQFDDCRGNVAAMLRGLNADPSNVRAGKDTAAHFEVKLVSRTANLLFLCNSVSQTLTVTRTTPGELTDSADDTASATSSAPVSAQSR